jgi:putative transposase
MTQMARNLVDETPGGVRQCRYLLHDHDAKFCAAFHQMLASEGIHALKLPPRSPERIHGTLGAIG